MLEGIQPFVVAEGRAQDFERPVGDHLVGVHVRRRARSALDHVDDELVVQKARSGSPCRRRDGVGARAVQQTEFAIGSAAACFTAARALMNSGYVDSAIPEIGKFSDARTVWIP